jgi:osmotically-inducible protein OsmY
MKKPALAAILTLALATCVHRAGAENYPPDNTGMNARDRSGDTLTSGDQSGRTPDMSITREIRKVIIADKDLSMNAHNVKIITANGVVTLRGPVNSNDEKTRIAALATAVVGVNRVDNQLEIARH